MENILISACLLGVCCRYDGESKPIMQTVALMERYHLIPVCPEQLGGLPTPREPSERQGFSFKSAAVAHGCRAAVLKERSPSCGSGEIYDGTFSGRLTPGDGATAALLKENGIAVYGESEIEALLAQAGPEEPQQSLF